MSLDGSSLTQSKDTLCCPRMENSDKVAQWLLTSEDKKKRQIFNLKPRLTWCGESHPIRKLQNTTSWMMGSPDVETISCSPTSHLDKDTKDSQWPRTLDQLLNSRTSIEEDLQYQQQRSTFIEAPWYLNLPPAEYKECSAILNIYKGLNVEWFLTHLQFST